MMVRAVFTCLALSAFAGFADASLIPFLVSGPTGTGPFAYVYSVTLSADERVDPTATDGNSCGGVACVPPGTFFTLYDVPGATVTSMPSGWTSSIQFTGITPGGISPADNGTLPNITFSYTGPVVDGPAVFSGFDLISTSNVLNPDGTFSYQATNNASDITNGTTDNGKGFVPLPAAAAAVPEPAYTALFLGLFALAFAARNSLGKRSSAS
jgi:hypothetical protein